MKFILFLMCTISLLIMPNRASSQQPAVGLQAIFEQATAALDKGNVESAADKLRLAAMGGHIEAQMLLANLYLNGQGVTQDTIEAYRWFDLAAKKGVGDARVNIETIIVSAAAEKNVQLLKDLKSCGADLNIPDDDGWTPLILAAAQGNIDMTRALLDAGADFNRSDKKGNTPLMVAVAGGNKVLVKELLRHGARKDLTNRDGVAAGDIARIKGHAEMVNLLKSASVVVKAPTTEEMNKRTRKNLK